MQTKRNEEKMITEEERIKELAHAQRMARGWAATLLILKDLDADEDTTANTERRLREWEATAEVLADPETVAALNESFGDLMDPVKRFVRVEEPK